MSDPHDGSGISVTIKANEPGGKYNDAKKPGTWIVFHGSPRKVAEQIVETFALGEEALARPLYDLVNEATDLFKAAADVSSGLGGRVIAPSGREQNGADSDVWAQVAGTESQKAEEPAVDKILAALEACSTVAEVQQVWAENQDAFNSNEEYMNAYKARGKALS